MTDDPDDMDLGMLKVLMDAWEAEQRSDVSFEDAAVMLGTTVDDLIRRLALGEFAGIKKPQGFVMHRATFQHLQSKVAPPSES